MKTLFSISISQPLLLLSSGVLVLMTSFHSKAEIFDTGFVKLDLPTNWVCEKQNFRWVCSDQSSTTSTAAIITIVGKQAASDETLENFKKILSQPKTLPSTTGQSTFSEVRRKGLKDIYGQTWVDTVHFASELENYVTNYLATRKGQVAIMVTLSAHKNYYAKYEPFFANVIQSLRVVAPETLTQPTVAANSPTPTPVGTAPVPAPGQVDEFEGNLMWKLKNDTMYQLGGLAAVLLIALGFYAIKS